MFDRAWLEERSSQSALLLLHSVGQARLFLQHRASVLMLETQEQALGSEWAVDCLRCRRLLDRSATFWLAYHELQRRKRKNGVGLLAPRPALPLPRAFNLNRRQKFDLNTPWRSDEPFLRRIAFCSDALAAFGALVIPLPLEAVFIDESFGRGCWDSIERQAATERAHHLASRLSVGWGNGFPARL